MRSAGSLKAMFTGRPSICFLAPNAFPVLAGHRESEFAGGAEVQQVIVAKGLAARGYNVSMICLDFGQPEEIEIDGVTVYRAFNKSSGVPVLRFIWPRLTSIWRCLERADADIYYQRSAGMLTGLLAAWCRPNRRFSVFAAAGNPDLVRDTPRVRYRRDRWIYQYGVRNVDRILVQNEEQQRLCRSNFGRDSTLIPNCYLPVDSPAPAGGGYVLWVATLRSLKQPELFLELARAMPDRLFRMVGGAARAEPRLFASIREQAAALPNVDFIGFVPYSEIDRHFDGACLLVNTSESEGFPNTFLQAWARGIPTLSFIDSGARADGRPVGLRVHTMDEMISSATNLLADRAERIREGLRCRDYCESNHGMEKVLDLYEQLFHELFNQRATRSGRTVKV